jgi:release factor glutamine methyltransferase
VSATVSESKTLDFGGLRIRYDERVLEPRPWTEAQSAWAAELIATAPPGPVLELCAGAGHIGLLAVSRSTRRLLSVDANPAACELTRANAAAAGLRVEVREGRMDEVLEDDEHFAVIIADPPWVPTHEVGTFPDDPVSAIDGGPEGLDVVRTCLEVIRHHLAVGGSAVLQVGPGQAKYVDALLTADDDLQIVSVRDYPRGSLVLIDRFDWGVAP